jgi:imidazolonepropionase-like amidohydrolase
MKPGLVLVLLAACAGAAVADEQPLLLEHAAVLDPSGERWLEDRYVLVVDGRIDRVGAAGEITPPAAATHIDLTGLHLVPGLIDLHSHLLLHPYNETSWDDQVLHESLEMRTLRASVAARTTLAAGWTTLRDLGTEGAGFADVALRDAIAARLIPGPRLFVATRAIVAVGCYGPSGFDPRWETPKGAQEVNGPDGMRAAVRAQIAAGADWVKVYADYRRRPGGPATPTLTRDEIAAAVDEARAAGLPVAAHASTAEGIRRAVEAGVATIEHGTEAGDKELRLMRERGVVLCPTLAASEAVARYAGWTPGQGPEPERVRQSREMFRRALRAGIVIACGSDVGVFAHGENARELELMVEYGMTPAQALRAATVVAAQVLRRGDELGRIAPGLRADLVAVRGDPLRAISALRAVVWVVAGGRIVAGHAAETLAPATPRGASR